jgi:hypothetical protein
MRFFLIAPAETQLRSAIGRRRRPSGDAFRTHPAKMHRGDRFRIALTVIMKE